MSWEESCSQRERAGCHCGLRKTQSSSERDGGGEEGTECGSLSWASNNTTNILMEADTFQFMQPKHFAALKEKESLTQPDGDKS